MTLAKKIREKNPSPYEVIAKKIGVSTAYVGRIARGQNKGIRGLGLKVRTELEKLIN